MSSQIQNNENNQSNKNLSTNSAKMKISNLAIAFASLATTVSAAQNLRGLQTTGTDDLIPAFDPNDLGPIPTNPFPAPSPNHNLLTAAVDSNFENCFLRTLASGQYITFCDENGISAEVVAFFVDGSDAAELRITKDGVVVLSEQCDSFGVGRSFEVCIGLVTDLFNNIDEPPADADEVPADILDEILELERNP